MTKSNKAKLEAAALKEIALKFDPEGYERMIAIQSFKKAIIDHQSRGLKKGQNVLPSGYFDKTGFHPTFHGLAPRKV